MDEENVKGQAPLQESVAKKFLIQRRLSACLSTLSVFASVKPELMVRHVDVFGPYMEVKPSTAAEFQVLTSVSWVDTSRGMM